MVGKLYSECEAGYTVELETRCIWCGATSRDTCRGTSNTSSPWVELKEAKARIVELEDKLAEAIRKGLI